MIAWPMALLAAWFALNLAVRAWRTWQSHRGGRRDDDDDES
jgi:cardiolipin synthase